MIEIVLVAGPPGSGKSTVARGIAEHFPVSADLKVDDLREMMVNGFEPPGEWTDETERQFVRARRGAIDLARSFAADGVTFVVDDVCVPEHFQDHYADLLREPGVTKIMLKPTIEALMRRLEARNGPWDSLLLESGAIAWSYEVLDAMVLDGWTVIDSSAQTVSETISTAIEQVSQR